MGFIKKHIKILTLITLVVFLFVVVLITSDNLLLNVIIGWFVGSTVGMGAANIKLDIELEEDRG